MLLFLPRCPAQKALEPRPDADSAAGSRAASESPEPDSAEHTEYGSTASSVWIRWVFPDVQVFDLHRGITVFRLI